MNQQEIDRLFERYSKPNNDFEPVWLVNEIDFTAAINEATAQARREALNEAAQLCKARGDDCRVARDAAITTTARLQWEAKEEAYFNAEVKIRALAAQPQDGTR
jgi:hypothetical protein